MSYGEEAITESNLLEIRRRHPEQVHIRTFTKAEEALKGADWEWHIIGRERTAKMRVQAKRIQCNDILRIKHMVASSGLQQRQLLMDSATEDNMKPVYCIYCTEEQRRIWKQARRAGRYEGFQAGCLLADASHVPLTTRKLEEIEARCIPWHYLFTRSAFVQAKLEFLKETDLKHQVYRSISFTPVSGLDNGDEQRQAQSTSWNAPTIDDLNGNTGRDFDRTGVEHTTEVDRARLAPDTNLGREVTDDDKHRLRKRGIQRVVLIDVREEPDFEWGVWS